MKRETKIKIRQFFHNAKEKVGDWLPWAIAIGGGAYIGYGCHKGIEANHELERHRKWANEEAVPKTNRCIDEVKEHNERLRSLERQVNELYEKALTETEKGESA